MARVNDYWHSGLVPEMDIITMGTATSIVRGSTSYVKFTDTDFAKVGEKDLLIEKEIWDQMVSAESAL